MAYRLKNHVTLLSGGIFNRECRCILYIKSDIDKRTQGGIKERLTRDKLTIMKHSNMTKKTSISIIKYKYYHEEKKQVLELTIHKERGGKIREINSCSCSSRPFLPNAKVEYINLQ